MKDSAFSNAGEAQRSKEMLTDLGSQLLRPEAGSVLEPAEVAPLRVPAPTISPFLIPAAVDVCLLILTWVTVNFALGDGVSFLANLISGLAFFLIYVAVVVLACEAQRLYGAVRLSSLQEESVAVWRSLALGTVLLVGIELLAQHGTFDGWIIVVNFLVGGLSLSGWRVARAHAVSRPGSPSKRHVLVIGAGDVGQSLARSLVQAKHLGYSFSGFLDHRLDAHPRVVGTLGDFAQVAREHFIDEVFITNPADAKARTVALQAANNGIDVTLVPELLDINAAEHPVGYIGSLPVISLHREPRPVAAVLLKRAIDIVGASCGMLCLAPLFALIALAIKLDSAGPVFYCAPRLGRKGHPFTFYKFRSMVDEADRMKDQLRQFNKRQGPTFKITNDPRITRIGRFLRRSSLDELPQLLNVLKGEMSLVGPRPHPLDDCEEYELEHLRRLEVTPGITGLWQVEGRKDTSFENNLAQDIEYIDNWSLWLDIKLLLRTIPAVFSGSGE